MKRIKSESSAQSPQKSRSQRWIQPLIGTPRCARLSIVPLCSASKKLPSVSPLALTPQNRPLCAEADFTMQSSPLVDSFPSLWTKVTYSLPENEAPGPQQAHSHTHLQLACVAWPLSLCWRGLWELQGGPRTATQKLLAISLMRWLGRAWLQPEQLVLGPAGTQLPSLKGLWDHPPSETGRAGEEKFGGLTREEKRKI